MFYKIVSNNFIKYEIKNTEDIMLNNIVWFSYTNLVAGLVVLLTGLLLIAGCLFATRFPSLVPDMKITRKIPKIKDKKQALCAVAITAGVAIGVTLLWGAFKILIALALIIGLAVWIFKDEVPNPSSVDRSPEYLQELLRVVFQAAQNGQSSFSTIKVPSDIRLTNPQAGYRKNIPVFSMHLPKFHPKNLLVSELEDIHSIMQRELDSLSKAYAGTMPEFLVESVMNDSQGMVRIRVIALDCPEANNLYEKIKQRQIEALRPRGGDYDDQDF